MLFLNQGKEVNDRKNDFMINLHESCVAGILPLDPKLDTLLTALWSPAVFLLNPGTNISPDPAEPEYALPLQTV